MSVHVKLSTSLRDYVPDYNPVTGLHREFTPGQTAADLAGLLALPPEEIKVVMINGAHAEMARALHDGDRVAFFPAVGGG